MNDSELIDAYLGGDERAFAQLAERHLGAVYSFALRFVGDQHEAEDIAQESFVKAWANLRRYKRATASFKTWLMRIVRNTAVDHLRKRRALPFSAFDDAEGGSPFEQLPDETAPAEEMLARLDDTDEVRRAVEQLSLPYREVLSLYYGSEMTFEQVAEVLDVPVNTVKSRHRRAMHRLRELLRI